MGLPFCRVFGQFSLQCPAMKAESPRRVRDVPAAVDQHPVDVFPLDAVGRHRLERGRDCRVGAGAAFEGGEDLVGICSGSLACNVGIRVRPLSLPIRRSKAAVNRSRKPVIVFDDEQRGPVSHGGA